MKVPVERHALQDYLRKLFGNDKLTVAARLKKTDPVELNNGPEFLGAISADDPKGSSFTLQTAMLDIDLDGACADRAVPPTLETMAMPLYSLEGRRPLLPPEGQYWIAPDANLIGDVRLGRDVGVWFGAVLRGDNAPIVVGARTNIQDLTALHTDMGFPVEIGEDCTIGHTAILHGCAIGDGSLIGMGAVVLDGARIGRGCLVGARALVTQGKAFPDHSLILGSPAKASRTLDEAAIEALRRSAEQYVASWRRYASGLKRIDRGA